MELINTGTTYNINFYCFLYTIKFPRQKHLVKPYRLTGHGIRKALMGADGKSEDEIRTDGKSEGEIWTWVFQSSHGWT